MNETMRYPVPHEAFALAEQPVLLNGMKVIFDQKVTLYPVDLEKRKPKEPHGRRDPDSAGRRA